MEDFEMDGGGEDEGQIAIAALKEMRGVLRAAMSRMPSQEAAPEEEEAAPLEAIEDVTDEPLEEAPIEESPMAEKKTVLSVLTPKYGGSSEEPPPPTGKLKAKKKGF